MTMRILPFSCFFEIQENSNIFNSIRDESDIWLDNAEEIQQAFLDFYQNLFGTSMSNRHKVFQSVVRAPGPNGFGRSFYHDNSELVVEDVKKAVNNFLSTRKILKEINKTNITLIPKIKCPDSVKDFSPISYCKVIYKAATKVICSRLRNVIPKIVTENQGQFVHGRYIAHNIMVFQDLIRHYKRKNCKFSCMIKTDLRKAYGTIE
uniref:Reverse transcriptase domain-containing protein n=1 Tax=Cannabis sativa TaxID=3483 RepID=A0A803QQ31_CANSA